SRRALGLVNMSAINKSSQERVAFWPGADFRQAGIEDSLSQLASLALLRSGELFRRRRDRFPVHFFFDQFGKSNVPGAQIGRGIDQGPAARATGRVELPHALGNEVNQNVGIAN